MGKLAKLVKSYRLGEKDALLEIINIFEPVLNKYSRNSYCEDLYSDLVLFLITLLDKIPLTENFLKEDKYIFSYILKSIKNKYIHLNIKSSKQFNMEVSNDEILNYDIGSCMESNLVFYDIIKNLTETEKNILNKKYVLNLSESDIAREMNVSRQSINKTHKRALIKLRQENYVN